MPTTEVKAFQLALSLDLAPIINALSQADVRRAQAFHRRELITPHAIPRPC